MQNKLEKSKIMFISVLSYNQIVQVQILDHIKVFVAFFKFRSALIFFFFAKIFCPLIRFRVGSHARWVQWRLKFWRNLRKFSNFVFKLFKMGINIFQSNIIFDYKLLSFTESWAIWWSSQIIFISFIFLLVLRSWLAWDKVKLLVFW